MGGEGPILVCFDGSDGGRVAVEAAAKLFPGHRAVVACYWQPFAESGGRLAINILELVQDPSSINAQEEALVADIADEGAAVAQGAGLEAEAQAVRIDCPIDEAVLTHADDLDAAAIVLGSRGRSGVRSLILGDVANEVVQRATRPVVVVPSSELSRRRREAADGSRLAGG